MVGYFPNPPACIQPRKVVPSVVVPPIGSGAGTASSAPSTSQSSSIEAAPVGQSSNSGSVNYSQAGDLIDRYLDGIGSESSWNLLTPGAQSVFGSQQGFQSYWSEHKVQQYGTIRAESGTSADGSVEMYVTVNGTRVHWRVVNTSAGLRIDANTQLG